MESALIPAFSIVMIYKIYDINTTYVTIYNLYSI